MNEREILDTLKELGTVNESCALLRGSLLRLRYAYPKQYRRIMDSLIDCKFETNEQLANFIGGLDNEVKQ